MASIRKRGNAWQARVIRKGFPEETATFKTSRRRWRGPGTWKPVSMVAGNRRTKEADAALLGDLLKRYRETVTPLKTEPRPLKEKRLPWRLPRESLGQGFTHRSGLTPSFRTTLVTTPHRP